ncbi:hypothetical protein Leryth_013855 [Lithospermum erythrorhizon]|nr:hypothetical protein Leryth_013855 [Lithospermum erythrorhizon]
MLFLAPLSQILGNFQKDPRILAMSTARSPQANYDLQVGDLFALTGDESSRLEIISSKPVHSVKINLILVIGENTLCSLRTNLTTNIRIWNALHPDPECGNFNIIRNLTGKSNFFLLFLVVLLHENVTTRNIKLIWGTGTGRNEACTPSCFALFRLKCRTLGWRTHKNVWL